MATGSKLDALKAKLSNVGGDDGIQVARKAAMIQMAYDRFSKDPSDEEYDDAGDGDAGNCHVQHDLRAAPLFV